MKRILFTLLFIISLLVTAGCSSGSEEASVSGNIVSQESVTLPDGANIQVQIQDVSLADAPAKVIGEQTIDGSGKSLPIPYKANYDPAAIEDRNSYSMSVRIEDTDGNLIYISDTNTPVITNGNPTQNVDVRVVSVNPSPGSSSGTIHNIEWQWRELSGGAVSPAKTIPNPENYTLILRTDGSFSGKADCNAIAGTYTNDKGRFSFNLGPSTMASCGPDSLDQEYLRLLSSVVAGGPSGADFALETAGGAERMTFINGGSDPES